MVQYSDTFSLGKIDTSAEINILISMDPRVAEKYKISLCFSANQHLEQTAVQAKSIPVLWGRDRVITNPYLLWIL